MASTSKFSQPAVLWHLSICVLQQHCSSSGHVLLAAAAGKMQEAERRAGKAKGSKYNGLVEEGRPCKTCGGSIHSKLHPLSSELEAMVRKDLGCTDAHVTEVMKQTPVALAVIEGYKPKPRSSIPASQVDTSQAAGTSSAGRWSVHVC